MPSSWIYIVLFFIVLILIWWRLFFYKKKIERRPFSSQWRNILLSKVQFYQNLNAAEKDRFEQNILNLLDSIKVTGIDLEITDTDRILVASSGVIPLFGFPDWSYRNLNEVLLYKGTFNHDYETQGAQRNILGMVGEGAMNRMMILSKPALHQGFEDQNSKSNVGIHEFVHLIDKLDGDTDGLPESLIRQPFVIPWLKQMHQEIQEIKKRDSNINPYGATNEAEFLSVVSEYFFNQPKSFAKKHPELHNLLETMYRQDLA